MSLITVDADVDFGGHSITDLDDLEVDSISTDVDFNSHDITEMGNITLVKNSGVQLLAELAAKGDWCGETVEATAGEPLLQFDCVFLEDDGRVWKSNATDDTEMPVKGIALADVATGASGVFLIEGFINNTDWGWAVGALLYAGTVDGGLRVSAPPASGNMVQRVGIAVSEDIIWFRPDLTMVKVA